MVAPVAYVETPHTLVHISHAHSWLAVLAASVPGLLLVHMYYCIIVKSTQPFPRMLDEHLGKVIGRILGALYIPFFIIVCSLTLRVFIEFMKMNVLPATPISVIIGVLLLASWAAVKAGLQSSARITEIINIIGVTFGVAIIIIALANSYHPERLLPIGYLNYKSLLTASLVVAAILGKLMPVLTLGFFIENKQQSAVIMRKVVFIFILLITLITSAILITRGIMPTLAQTFPVFSMIRLAHIGAYLQNLDIFFIAIWILGIFGSVFIPWFMACYTTQQVFNLQDYRFVATPTAMIIGVLSILISRNNLEVVIWSQKIIPVVFSLFFIGIPLLIFIITLFKPVPMTEGSETANPTEASSA